MKFRVARHTRNLQPLIDFYTLVLGLTVLGDFKDHAGYNGVFIGDNNWHWHLEFTTSADEPQHEADVDDMLVFYADTKAQYDAILARAISHDVPQTAAKNPYWASNGITLLDPDGFRVVVTIAHQ